MSLFVEMTEDPLILSQLVKKNMLQLYVSIHMIARIWMSVYYFICAHGHSYCTVKT